MPRLGLGPAASMRRSLVRKTRKVWKKTRFLLSMMMKVMMAAMNEMMHIARLRMIWSRRRRRLRRMPKPMQLACDPSAGAHHRWVQTLLLSHMTTTRILDLYRGIHVGFLQRTLQVGTLLVGHNQVRYPERLVTVRVQIYQRKH